MHTSLKFILNLQLQQTCILLCFSQDAVGSSVDVMHRANSRLNSSLVASEVPLSLMKPLLLDGLAISLMRGSLDTVTAARYYVALLCYKERNGMFNTSGNCSGH